MPTVDPPSEPVRRPGNIPHALLDEHALTVVRRLQSFGHEAYLVGGCVRDLLVGLEPKDFDVVTDALPNRIKRLFRNARIIGRRFRLAHIRFGPDHVIETSTFRAEPPGDGAPAAAEERHRVPRGQYDNSENIFGTAPEDARRRDFTINALFYDPLTDEVIDFTGGLDDLETGVVRAIGNPPVRIREDPVRMIRAAHFAARMGFSLEPELEQALKDQAHALADASPARLYVELIKVLQRACARPTLHQLFEFGVLHHWLPELAGHFEDAAVWPEANGGTHEEARRGEPEDLPIPHATWNLLGAADHWGMGAHDADEALALAPLLGPWIVEAWHQSRHGASYLAYQDVFEETVRPLARRMSIPRRTLGRLRDLLWLWMEIRHLPQGKRASRIARRPAFRLALDFLRLDLMARDQSLETFLAWEDLAPPRSKQGRPYDDDRRREPRGRSRSGSRGARGRDDRGPGDRGGGERRRGERRRSRAHRAPHGGDGPPALREEAAAWTPAPPRAETPAPPRAEIPAPPRAEPPAPNEVRKPPRKPRERTEPPPDDGFADGLD